MTRLSGPPSFESAEFPEASLARCSRARQDGYEAQAEGLVRDFAPSGVRRDLDRVADQLLASAGSHEELRGALLHLAAAVRRLARDAT